MANRQIITAQCGCLVPATKQYAQKHSCSKCGAVCCDRHLYFYVDENNIAITRNSRPYCAQCYNDLSKYTLKFNLLKKYYNEDKNSNFIQP